MLSLARLQTHFAARISLGRVHTLDVLVQIACLLRLMIAVRALFKLTADVMDVGLVLRDVAVRLRLVIAMRGLVPLYADVVLVGLVPRDLAVRLGPYSQSS